MITLAATKIAPNMTVTAAATDRTMTSRTLLVAAVLERTAQRSHRGYRPASHMASCKEYDRNCGASPPGAKSRIVYVLLPTPTDQEFFTHGRHSAEPPDRTGDTLRA